MESGPKIAVIIPNFNGETFILRTLELLRKSFDISNIFIVDDCSTDDSVFILETKGFHVIQRSVNGGFAASVNTGLMFLKSKNIDFALVCNSDLEPTKLQCMEILESLEYFYDDESVAVIGFREVFESKRSPQDPEDISGFLFWLRLNILNTVGLIDERFYMYGEETDFFRRVIANNYQIIQSNIFVSHATEKSGKSKLRNSWFAIRNCIFLEVKSGKYIIAFKKIIVLLMIMLWIKGEMNDPSVRRLRRPGILLGPILLSMAVMWNILQVIIIKIYNKHA